MRHERLAACLAALVVVRAPGLGQAARAVWEAGALDQEPDTKPLAFLRIEGPTERGRLLVLGDFLRVGGVDATGIAIWDGEAWESVTTALRPGTAQAERAVVRCAARFDDGTGEAWYFGGAFTDVSGAIRNVVRWRGGALEAVGGGLGTGASGEEVLALVVHDDGSGAALYAGGGWYSGPTPRRLARWRGAGWEQVGPGEPLSTVRSLWSEPDGEWRGLYAGGAFATIGGVPARGTAVWNGAEWRGMDRGFVGGVQQIVAFDRGEGLGRRIRTPGFVWDGATWQEEAGPTGYRFSVVRVGGVEMVFSQDSWDVMRVIPTGLEPVTTRGSTRAQGPIAAFDPGWGDGEVLIGTGWPTTQSNPGFSREAPMLGLRSGAWTRTDSLAGKFHGAAVADIGDGVRMYASQYESGGWPDRVRIFSWDLETPWSEFSLTEQPRQELSAPGHVLQMHRLGSGDGSLYATSGPNRWFSSSTTQNGLFRFRNGAWEYAGAGAGSAITNAFSWGKVYDSAVFDDGNGPAVFVCGGFSLPLPDGTLAKGLARWDGKAWSAVEGLSDILGSTYLTDLEVFDDGTGLALYVCGGFYAEGISPAYRSPFARWNGVGWSVELPPWSFYTLGTFAKLRTHQGERLFGMTGNLFLERVNGAWQSRIPSYGPGHLTLVRESEGARVPRAPGGPARGVVLGFRNEGTAIQWAHLNSNLRPYLPLAVWDHSRWSYVRVRSDGGWLERMMVVPRGDHEDVWLAGSFTTINGAPAPNLVRLVALETTCAGDADFSGAVDMSDLSIVLGAFGMSTPIANQDPHPADLDVNEKVDFYDLMIVLGNFGVACPTQE